MKYLLTLLMLLCSWAFAHPEPVSVVLRLQPRANMVNVAAQMVGQQSTLPIRGAEVYLYFYTLNPELQRLLQDGQISTTNTNILPKNPMIKLRLEEQNTAYSTNIPLSTGNYAIAVVDTTFKGENAIAIAPFEWQGKQEFFQVLLPKTNTPSSYLWYAIAGLALPLLLGIGLALGRRKA